METGVIQRVPESEVSCHYSLVFKFLNRQRGEGYGFLGLGLGPIQRVVWEQFLYCFTMSSAKHGDDVGGLSKSSVLFGIFGTPTGTTMLTACLLY